MHDSLFEDQGHLDDPHLWERAERLGLDLDRFEADRRSEAVAERVERDFRTGIRAGVATTPTLFVDGERTPRSSGRKFSRKRCVQQRTMRAFGRWSVGLIAVGAGAAAAPLPRRSCSAPT